MANHLNSDQQLDQAVKEALDSYEVPFDSSAWAEMEKSLDTAPKSFQPFKKWSFSLNSIIIGGVTILAGGLLVFAVNASDNKSRKSETTVTTETPAREDQQKPVNTVTSAHKNTETPVMATEAPKNDQPEQIEITPPNNTTAANPLAQQKKKRENNKTNTTAPSTGSEGEFNFMEIAEKGKNSPPAFGDQIDPSKGFVLSTGESNDTREAARKNLAFSDQVLLGMKKDSASTSQKKAADEPKDDSVSTSDNKPTKKPKKDRPKKDKPKEEVSFPGTEVNADTGKTGTNEKNDSVKVKRNRETGNPQYKGERTPIEPY
jgi:hypothetical protein